MKPKPKRKINWRYVSFFYALLNFLLVMYAFFISPVPVMLLIVLNVTALIFQVLIDTFSK